MQALLPQEEKEWGRGKIQRLFFSSVSGKRRVKVADNASQISAVRKIITTHQQSACYPPTLVVEPPLARSSVAV